MNRSLAVIGAGIIGTGCALALKRAGRDVVLIDPSEPGNGCSFGNAGHIATEQTVPLASADTLAKLPSMLLDRHGPLAFRPEVLPQLLSGWAWQFLKACRAENYRRGSEILGGMAGRAMADLKALLQDTPAAHRLDDGGHHHVWQSPSPAAEISRFVADAEGSGLKVEAWRDGDWPTLPDAVRRRISGGVTFAGTGHVTSPYLVVQGLREAFVALGGREVRAAVRQLQPGPAGWQVVHDGGSLAVDEALVCMGVDSGDLLEPLGYKVPLVAERGYHIALLDTRPELEKPIVFEERTIIATPMENELRSTTTTEFSKRGLPPTKRRWELLRQHMIACGLMKGGERTREWMGHRPTLPDFLPVIGRSANHASLYFAFGHQHLGLTLSGVTARLVAAMIIDGAAPPSGLALERFAR